MEVQANHVEGKKMEEGVADSKGKRKDISRSQDTLEVSPPALTHDPCVLACYIGLF